MKSFDDIKTDALWYSVRRPDGNGPIWLARVLLCSQMDNGIKDRGRPGIIIYRRLDLGYANIKFGMD